MFYNIILANIHRYMMVYYELWDYFSLFITMEFIFEPYDHIALDYSQATLSRITPILVKCFHFSGPLHRKKNEIEF